MRPRQQTLRLFFYSLFYLLSQSLCAQSLPDSLFKDPRPDTLDVIALNQIAYDNYWNNPSLALICAYRAKHIADTIQYYAGLSEAYRQIGIISWAQGNLGTAHHNLLQSLQIAEVIKRKQLIADGTGNLGLVYFAMGDNDQAMLHHQNSLLMQRELKNEMRESVALNNLGDVYRAQGRYENALEAYNLALELRRKLNQPVGEATNLRNIGNLYEETGDFQKALEYYAKSLGLAETYHDKRGKCQNLASMASVYLKQKKYELAERKAKAALVIALENNYKIAVREIYKILSEIAEATKNTAVAYAYYKKYSTYKDTVMNSEIGFEISTQRLDYETAKKQLLIENLQQHNLEQKREMGRKNVLLFSIGLILFLVFLLLAIIIRNYKRQKMLNKLLALKNEEIQFQKKELEDHRNELMALNEEITAQHEELIEQRDVLARKNEIIARMNAEITSINQNLENTVAKRTALLEKQNQQLKQFAFFNAHKLRAPLASILGLVSLLKGSGINGEQKEIIDHLETSSQDLDRVVRSISEVIHDGLAAYDEANKK